MTESAPKRIVVFAAHGDDLEFTCQNNDQFGFAVAVDGDIVVVGADDEDTLGSDAGAAYVSQRNEGGADNWAEWRAMSGNLINHHGLNLGMPEHRAQLRAAMKEFLSLEA